MARIDKTTILIEHMDQTKHFYARTLNLTFHPFEFANRTLYRAAMGAMELLLCLKDLAGVKADTNTIQLRFVLEDVEQTYRRGPDSLGTMLSELQEIEGRQSVSLRDPERNSLELIAQ
ncbi:MAG TPA: hypothetical protein VKP65_21960 [Rhodothermales bacterium]|nr:hypothetical protein [Rhodothermales bacterium]